MYRLSILKKLEKIAIPAAATIAITVGAVAGFVQIRQRTALRKKWFVPTAIIITVVLAGFIGAVVERVVDSQPRLQCLNGTYAGDNGAITCRAVLATSIPNGAVARCNDNTYSFNRDTASLCSRHGGVQATLK